MPREDIYRHLDEFVNALDCGDSATASSMTSSMVTTGCRGGGSPAPTRWGSPLLQMFHTLGQMKNSVARTADELEPELRIAAEGRIITAADRIIAANPVEREHLAAYYGADRERVAVIPCGVDTELFTPAAPAAAKARLGLPEAPLLVYVGRLAPIKGLETLLESMALLPARPFLLIVGGDQESRRTGTSPTCAGSSPCSTSPTPCASSGPSPRSGSASSMRRRRPR